MRVRSSDGAFLGRIAEVWCGDDPKEGREGNQAVCSRIEVHPATAGLLQRTAGPALYVPCDAIARVTGKRIELGVEARVAAERWTGEPMWIRKARARLAPSAAAAREAYDAIDESSLWGRYA